MFFSPKPLTRATARNAAIVNLLVAPGLGTLMLGEIALGIAQLAIVSIGCALILIWFAGVMWNYYGQIAGTPNIPHLIWVGVVGLLFFIGAWVWSLISSLIFIRRARQAPELPTTPPVISP